MAPTFTWDLEDYRDHIWTLARLGASDGDTSPLKTFVTIRASAIQLGPEIQTITTQGTDIKYETTTVDKFDLTISQNVLAGALAQLVMVSGTLVGSEITRQFYDGDYSRAPNVELELTSRANRISDGALRYFRYIFPKCNVKSGQEVDAFAPSPASLSGSLILSAQKTTTDVLGVAITMPAAVSTNGVFMYKTKSAA